MPDIDFISLGCAKNLVDAERLMYVLQQRGYTIHHDPPQPTSPIVVINTCAFIADAKEESINTILEFAQAKTEGRIRKLYVMGCLSQRYKEQLATEIPEVDAFYGKYDFFRLADDIQQPSPRPLHTSAPVAHDISVPHIKRLITTPSHYAYVKIAEGCNHRCAYCIIPHITGQLKSRPMEEILQEVRWLVDKGVKEFQLIAQDLTDYGRDIDGQAQLPQLVDSIAQIPGVEWLRLHYAYPTDFPWQLLDVINAHPNVCRYLDVALQHISTPILQAMRRRFTREQTLEFIHKLRRRCPGIQLRTTLIVGFPGETEQQFQELLDFVGQARFERLGAFAYSEEEGTYSAAHYADDIPQHVKQQRLDTLMALQQDIAEQLQHEEVGKTHRIIIDRREGDYYVGRNQYSSPEVDPEILIPAQQTSLQIGQFYHVRITQATPFDLYASVVNTTSHT